MALPAPVEFAAAVARRFHEERAMQTAGSLTYTTLLSLVPLFTVALAVSTAFPAFDNWIGALQDFIFEYVLPDTPAIDAVSQQINAFTQNAGKLTAIGLVAFGVTAVMLMVTIDTALNRMFRVQRGRTVLQSVFMYWAVITLGPVLIGASLSMSSFAVAASLGWLNLGAAADVALRVLPILFTCAALTLLYAIVPARRVPWRHAIAGGILAGILFELAKRGFALYLSRVPTYQLIYGAFATIPIFLLWLYTSWLVVMIGAAFTATLPAWGAPPDHRRAPGQRMADALAVLAMLSRAHQTGKVERLGAMARELRVLPYRVEEVLERAAALGWTVRTHRDGWVLARDADRITVGELYRIYAFDSETIGVPEADFGLSLREYAERKAAE